MALNDVKDLLGSIKCDGSISPSTAAYITADVGQGLVFQVKSDY